jgi:transcriptional regulator of acetoin/glycerol metabolism
MSKAAVQHINRVSETVETYAAVPQHDVVEKSWFRSATAHRIDPASRHSPKILTGNELRDFRDPSSRLITIARGELDRLYTLVRHAHYVVLLCDRKGVVIDHRGEDGDAADFSYWGTWLGGIWSEEAEGTNGIGTCLVEQVPVTVHRSQHFRARHIGLSCSGAPLFDAEGELAGVLDVSCIDPERSEHAHALTGALTIAAARTIAERAFRDHFRREWIIAAGLPEAAACAMLIAMNAEGRIVGLDRTGRRFLASHRFPAAVGAGMWDVFERNDALHRHKEREDLWTELQLRGVGSLPAIVTPPAHSARWQRSDGEDFALRPRLDALNGGRRMLPANKARGGLPPAMLRRVREYVDAHLDEHIDLDTLAGAAGLSLYHFARAFKQSEGATPHLFVLRRRLAKAQELLADHRLSLSEIAFSVGFADQSHFARRFREMVGMAPGQFRKLRD